MQPRPRLTLSRPLSRPIPQTTTTPAGHIPAPRLSASHAMNPVDCAQDILRRHNGQFPPSIEYAHRRMTASQNDPDGDKNLNRYWHAVWLALIRWRGGTDPRDKRSKGVDPISGRRISYKALVDWRPH